MLTIDNPAYEADIPRLTQNITTMTVIIWKSYTKHWPENTRLQTNVITFSTTLTDFNDLQSRAFWTSINQIDSLFVVFCAVL